MTFCLPVVQSTAKHGRRVCSKPRFSSMHVARSSGVIIVVAVAKLLVRICYWLPRCVFPSWLSVQVKKYHESALIEAQILRDVNSKERAIRRQKQQESLCVEMLGQFEHLGHCCLVFECLGLSLYDYLKKNEYRGFPMNILRPIAQELLQVRYRSRLRCCLFALLLRVSPFYVAYFC